MEIMTKEEYLEKIAETALHELINIDAKRWAMVDAKGNGEFAARADLRGLLELNGYEHDDEFEAVYQGDLNTAYDEYVKSNEKDHIFDIEFHYTVYGTAQVHAKDEDEAREYVNDELYVDGANVYFSDDEKAVDDVSIIEDCEGIEIDSVDDTGDEYED